MGPQVDKVADGPVSRRGRVSETKQSSRSAIVVGELKPAPKLRQKVGFRTVGVIQQHGDEAPSRPAAIQRHPSVGSRAACGSRGAGIDPEPCTQPPAEFGGIQAAEVDQE